MVEYNLGQGTEPKVTQGSQQHNHSIPFLFPCSRLKIPSFPSTPGQGRSLCPHPPSDQDQEFPLPSVSSSLPGPEGSPVAVTPLTLWDSAHSSKISIAKLPCTSQPEFLGCFCKTNPKCSRRGAQCPHFVVGRREGRMSLSA